MTKFYFTTEEDRDLIDNSFDYVSKLIFGANHKDDIKLFKQLFMKKVEAINVYPQGTSTEFVNKYTPGICRYNPATNNPIIEMLGYTYALDSERKFIEHEGVHEMCHAFADLLPMLSDRKPVIRNGIVRENHAGLIRQKDPHTGELTSTHYYGKMFTETMMDMVSAMAINQFAPDITYTTIDDVLNNHYNTTGNAETGYSFLTSITRLVIAAFSNVGHPNFNYQKVADMGESIFKLNAVMADGSRKKANDFLYGIMFDPLHIEQEFNKYFDNNTGKTTDAYRYLCMYLDDIFRSYKDGTKLPSDKIKLVMDLLSDFCNMKKADYIRNGVMTNDEICNMVSTYNKIFNQMQVEYKAFFSSKDFDDIRTRAGKY